MDASDSLIQSVSNEVIDIEINNEPRCSIESPNEFRKTSAESTHNNAKRIKMMAVPETEMGNSDCNKRYDIIDILENGEESAQDTSNAFEEDAVKKLKDPNSEVEKSRLTKDPLTGNMTLALGTALEKNEFSPVDEKMKGQRIIDCKMASIENFDLDSTELKAPLNGRSCSPQTVKSATGICASRKRLACDTVEDVAKKRKTSMDSETMNEDSLMATDQLDENNTVSVNESLRSKTMIKSCDLTQGSLYREVVNEDESSKDSIFASSSVDCSLLKYFRLNTEIRDEELTECIDYLSKLCPKKDSFAVFFENPERKLIKQSDAPISLASGHAFLSILSKKLRCNSTAGLNLHASTLMEVDLNDEDSSYLSSIRELVKILPVASVSSACSDNSNLNNSLNIPSSKSIDEEKLPNVPDFTLHIPHSEENWSSLPNEEAKVKPTAICGPILCSESGTIYNVASDRNTSRSLSSCRQRELFIHDMKAVMSQIEVMNELLQSSQSTYSRFLSGNDQSTLQLNRNRSKESDVQILSRTQTASISTDHGPTSRNHYSENISALVTSKELNCVTCTEPVTEEMQGLGTKSAFNDPRQSGDTVSEISSAQTSTQGPELSESSEKLIELSEKKIESIEPVVIKEKEVQCLNRKPTVFSDTTHSPDAIPETSSEQTSTDGLGISESNEGLQISMKLVKEYEHIPNSDKEDSQSSPETSTEGKVIREINPCEMSYLKETNINDQNNSFTSETFEDELDMLEKNTSSTISRNQTNVQNKLTTEDKVMREINPCEISYLKETNINDKNNSFISEIFDDELDMLEKNTSSPISRNQPDVQNKLTTEGEVMREINPCEMSYLKETNINDQNNSFTSETFEDEVDMLEKNTTSPISRNKPNVQNKLTTEGEVMREINPCEMSYLKETNINDQNNSFTSETFEDEVDMLEKNISSPISRNQPNVRNKLNLLEKQSRNAVNSGNNDKVKELALNVSDPKMSCSRIVETSTDIESDIEDTESTNTQDTQHKSIEIPGSSLMNKFLNTNLTISVTSGNKRIVRAREPNILYIVPLTPSTLKSQTQRHEISSGEASHSVQVSQISNASTSRTNPFMPKMKKSQASEIRTVQRGKNIPKISNPATRTSVDLKERRNSYWQMSDALETFKAEDDERNLKASIHVELPKRVPSEVTSMKEASDSIFFIERKGNRAYLAERSYKNVGNIFITNDDLPSLILEWNATWLSTQEETKMCAPICDKYYHVKDRYVDELDYYNTFFPLHLLSIWLRISDSWKKNTATFDSVFETEKELRNAVKITCYTALDPNTCVSWLRLEDILLCRALKPGGGAKELFGRICNVTYTDYETDDMYCGTSSRLKKVTFQFLCAEALNIPNLITVKIQILDNIRTALLQNDALQYLNGVTKDLILDPENHRSSMDFITLLPRFHQDFKKCKEDIIDSIMSPRVHVTMVDLLVPWDITFVTLQLATTLIKRNRPVLIGVRDIATLIKMAYALKHYYLILAVKRGEVRLPDDLRRFTLDERCRLLNREVFLRCHVTLTLLSNIYMGDLGDVVAEQQLTCILPNAHLCTETESALLLYYDVKHLVLIGRNERNPNLHSVLKRFGYDISLFNRLYKAK